MNYKMIDIATRDARELGKLSFFEECRDFPYEIKRVYYIYDCPAGTERGGHAHMHLNQLLFCPFGSIEIILDDSAERVSIILNNPQKGLVIGPGLWREMIWKKDGSVLCVAASEYYDEKDYIRDYNKFQEYARKNR
jgi:hypothetical protein